MTFCTFYGKRAIWGRGYKNVSLSHALEHRWVHLEEFVCFADRFLVRVERLKNEIFGCEMKDKNSQTQ